jgi:hypothetical protein
VIKDLLTHLEYRNKDHNLIRQNTAHNGEASSHKAHAGNNATTKEPAHG